MLGRGAGKLFDATDYVATQAGRRVESLGSWVVPFCYRRTYGRIARVEPTVADERAGDEDMVRTIGTMAMYVRSREIVPGTEEVQVLARAIGQSLRHGIDYGHVFDPHQTVFLKHYAPLHIEEKG
jgi:hypothetical protein